MSHRPGRRPPSTNATPRQAMTADQALELAGDLLRELAGHIGDPDAVNATMLRWHETHGSELGLVSMAAVRRTFAECLTWPPNADIPPGASIYANPTEGTTDDQVTD